VERILLLYGKLSVTTKHIRETYVMKTIALTCIYLLWNICFLCDIFYNVLSIL